MTGHRVGRFSLVPTGIFSPVPHCAPHALGRGQPLLLPFLCPLPGRCCLCCEPATPHPQEASLPLTRGCWPGHSSFSWKVKTDPKETEKNRGRRTEPRRQRPGDTETQRRGRESRGAGTARAGPEAGRGCKMQTGVGERGCSGPGAGSGPEGPVGVRCAGGWGQHAARQGRVHPSDPPPPCLGGRKLSSFRQKGLQLPGALLGGRGLRP